MTKNGSRDIVNLSTSEGGGYVSNVRYIQSFMFKAFIPHLWYQSLFYNFIICLLCKHFIYFSYNTVYILSLSILFGRFPVTIRHYFSNPATFPILSINLIKIPCRETLRFNALNHSDFLFWIPISFLHVILGNFSKVGYSFCLMAFLSLSVFFSGLELMLRCLF